MRRARGLRIAIAAVCAIAGLLGASTQAQAAAEDPLWVFTPKPPPPPALPPFYPPPSAELNDPCGMAVDPSTGSFLVSDYYHDAVDVYEPNANYASPSAIGATGYLFQVPDIDTVDGPCSLVIGASDNLYVNDYHRAVIHYPPDTQITGAETDGAHPTGVAADPASGRVYVDERTYVAVFEEDGTPVEEGGEPLHIGEGSLEDGYGIAFSSYPGTAGYLYLPDAATNTVKVYDTTAIDKEHPVAELDGSNTPNGNFVSLRDASVAVDRVTGEVYLLDDLQPQYTEKPQAVVYVSSSSGAYEGHLKYLVTDGWPSGLAVDNSTQASQGRVYVTSGNTTRASIYAYGPGAATTAPISLPDAASPPAQPGAAQGEEVTAPVDTAIRQPSQESPSAAMAMGAMPLPASVKRRSSKPRRKPKAHHRRKVRKEQRGAPRVRRRGVRGDR